MSNIAFHKAITPADRRHLHKSRLLKHLAELRHTYETGSVMLPEDVEIQGGREARQELAAQHMLRQTGVADGPLHWKGPQGWITLSPDMLGLALWKISNHTQACFQAEQIVHDQILSDALISFDGVKDAFLSQLKL